MNQNDKRAAVCRLEFLPLSQATVKNRPGDTGIQVQGDFIKIPIASGEFRETGEPGYPVEQELEAVVTDTGSTNLQYLHALLAQYGLVLLTLTNCDRRLVGTDEYPVLFTTEISGVPATLTLSFKRSSPEPAKVFSSF